MWFRQLDTPVQPHNSPIVALFRDGCTSQHLTFIDGQGWSDAEDCYPWGEVLEGVEFWTPAPSLSKYPPAFMEAYPDD